MNSVKETTRIIKLEEAVPNLEALVKQTAECLGNEIEKTAKLSAEIERLKARGAEIDAALKRQGLFAFEHVDGTFTINMR